MNIKFDNGSEINTIDTEEPFRSEINNSRLIDFVDSVEATTNKDYEWAKSWIIGMIEEMKDNNDTEYEIIEKLKEYGEVKVIEK